MKEIEGQLCAVDAEFCIIVARFNGFLVDSLLNGAVDALKRHAIAENRMTIVRVPGAYEMPLIAKRMAKTQKYQAIIALGAVIRGSTPHFDYVAGECAKGLTQVAMEYEIPVSFGVLTTDTIEQAIERSGTKAGNKGAEAAMTALEMVNLLKQI